MANPAPNPLALSVINDNDLAVAAVLRNNFAAIQAAVNLLRAIVAGGSLGQVLQAVDATDVQWGIVPGQVLQKGKKTSNVSTSGTTFGAGADLLAADLTFTADGTSDYGLFVSASRWQNSTSGAVNELDIKLDGADQGEIAQLVAPAANVGDTLCCLGVIQAPAAGAHTVNARMYATAGTATAAAGTGGAGGSSPILVMVVKLG
jgi:hypothetical protein